MDTTHPNLRVTRTGRFDLPISVREAFPLFSPEGEQRWVWGWQPQPVYPPDMRTEDGAVFVTSHNGEDAVWVVSRYEPEAGRVEYTTFRAGDRVGRVSLLLTSIPQGCLVQVTYTFTALSEKGKRHIAHFSEAHYAGMMVEWHNAITHFLTTGEMLQP